MSDFERLAHEGSVALETGRAEQAAATARSRRLHSGAARLSRISLMSPTSCRSPRVSRSSGCWRSSADSRRRSRSATTPTRSRRSRRSIAEHPLRERLRGLLMLALYRSGRQAEALDAYRRARTTLVDELGIEPGSWLRELEAAMLRQDSLLELHRRSQHARRRSSCDRACGRPCPTVDSRALVELAAATCPATRTRARRRHHGRLGRRARPCRDVCSLPGSAP